MLIKLRDHLKPFDHAKDAPRLPRYRTSDNTRLLGSVMTGIDTSCPEQPCQQLARPIGRICSPIERRSVKAQYKLGASTDCSVAKRPAASEGL
jgi:hypothetical protein